MTTATQELLLATDAVRIEAGADKTPAVNILAYTGGVMAVPGWGPLVIDLAGIDVSASQVSILADHDATLSGVIGFGRATAPVSGTVPNVLEFGGAISVSEQQITFHDQGQKVTRWVQANPRRHGNREVPRRRRRVRVEARPFMGPALEAEAQHIPDAWAGSVRG